MTQSWRSVAFSSSRGTARSCSSLQSGIRRLCRIQTRESAPSDCRRLRVRSVFAIPWHYCTIKLTYCICPISQHTSNPFHSSSPLPLVLVAVINISQVYESYLGFVSVEKQTARRLSRGAICVPLFSGACERMLPGAPCLSYQHYLQMEQRRLKVIMKLEVFHHALAVREKRKRVQ